jgi:hypothetical protein
MDATARGLTLVAALEAVLSPTAAACLALGYTAGHASASGAGLDRFSDAASQSISNCQSRGSCISGASASTGQGALPGRGAITRGDGTCVSAARGAVKREAATVAAKRVDGSDLDRANMGGEASVPTVGSRGNFCAVGVATNFQERMEPDLAGDPPRALFACQQAYVARRSGFAALDRTNSNILTADVHNLPSTLQASEVVHDRLFDLKWHAALEPAMVPTWLAELIQVRSTLLSVDWLSYCLGSLPSVGRSRI